LTYSFNGALLYQRQDMGLTDLVAMTGQLIAVDKAQQ
jgi:hypothetical protein